MLDLVKNEKKRRKSQVSYFAGTLAYWWAERGPGSVHRTGIEDSWWACAAPPWMTVVIAPDSYELEPVHPLKWLKKWGWKPEEPSERAHQETKELWAAGCKLATAFQFRMDEKPDWEAIKLKLNRMLNMLALGPCSLAVDTETTGLTAFTDKLVGVSICCRNSAGLECSVYIPAVAPSLMGMEGSRVLTHPHVDKVYGWNSPFDQAFIDQHLPGLGFKFIDDVKLAAWITNLATVLGLPTGGEEGRAPSLKETASALLGVRGVPFNQLLKSYAAKDITEVPWVAQNYYATHDAEWTMALEPKVMGLLSTKAAYKETYDIEKSLWPVTAEMSQGWRIDMGAVVQHRDELFTQRVNIASDIACNYGLFVDLAKEEDIREAVYGNTPAKTLTKVKREPSLAKAALKELGTPLANMLVSLSETDKLLDAFIHPLHEAGQAWLYPDWRATGTWSGRYSCARPNIQQVPWELRDIFLPDNDDSVIVDADFDQLELRIMAALSGDRTMFDILLDGRNMHEEMGAMLGTDKRGGKIANFSSNYGSGAASISRQTGCTVQEAEELLAGHRRLLPQLHRFKKQWISLCRERGYSVAKAIPYVRLLPDLNSPLRDRRAEAERQAWNHLIQGTAGGIVKMVMQYVYELGHKQTAWAGKIRLLGQIHDELVYSVDQSPVFKFSQVLRMTGEAVGEKVLGRMPLVFTPTFGPNWMAAKPK